MIYSNHYVENHKQGNFNLDNYTQSIIETGRKFLGYEDLDEEQKGEVAMGIIMSYPRKSLHELFEADEDGDLIILLAYYQLTRDEKVLDRLMSKFSECMTAYLDNSIRETVETAKENSTFYQDSFDASEIADKKCDERQRYNDYAAILI